MSLPDFLKRRIITLSAHTVNDDGTHSPEKEYAAQKRLLRQRYDDLPGLEKALFLALSGMCLLVVIQFIWIVALQYQVSLLREQAHTQETRMAQLEQANKKHNNLLYSVNESLEDLQKKWHNLHFRVLENTWKLGN